MAFKALIFDMDGLMIDSERLYFQTEREMAKKFNRRIEDKILWQMMGRKPIESMRIFKSELGIPVKAETLLKIRDDLMREKLKNDLVSMPGLENIIGSLNKQLKLAISTGAPQEFLDIVVNKLEIRDKFSVLQASDEIKNGKPHPEIYLTTCKKLKLLPRECIVLEDSLNGALAGQKAGCYVIAVPSEYSKGQELDFVDFLAEDLFAAKIHIKELLNEN